MPASLNTIDLVIIAGYLMAMIGIGVYYSLSNKTAEDYLLGSRRMPPRSVGLSLFASLLSTISFLAWPGEVIKHGPSVLFQALAYPIVFFLVGWFLIPKIMKQPVTSAYELLEAQLGLVPRYLASLMFVLLRTLWMAVVVYATVDKVIVPVFELDSSLTPWLCAILGLVTVIYSVLGGLRAVVTTDVIQTGMLLTGAIVALILITWNLGGPQYVLPTEWPDHWSQPRVNFHWSERSMFGFMLNFICWYVATMGSDQMAIQRFLSTHDKKSARRVLGTALSIDAIVFGFMVLVGLALMSWFLVHPDWLAAGESVYDDADRLFPLFIVKGLPVGLTGVVIAGLMAAAMSSLSSGINSSAAVITTDWLRGIAGWKMTAEQELRMARVASAAMGVVVVAIALSIRYIQGSNLFELTVKVSNLMTAPLFVLFFTAMFVRRANALTAVLAAVTALAVAVRIAFVKELGLSSDSELGFLWILPLSLAAGIFVSVVTSFIFGKRRPTNAR